MLDERMARLLFTLVIGLPPTARGMPAVTDIWDNTAAVRIIETHWLVDMARFVLPGNINARASKAQSRVEIQKRYDKRRGMKCPITQ